MSIHLQRVRLSVTTGKGKNDGTDDAVFLDFNVRPHPLSSYGSTGWQRENLDTPDNDRERGRTDVYNLNFTSVADDQDVIVGVGASVYTTFSIPEGIAFDSFEKVRDMPFFLILNGDDFWKLASYNLMGHFMESWTPPNAIDSNVIYDHGWLLLTAHDVSIGLSQDPDEAPRSFLPLIIDAAFPPEQEPEHVVISRRATKAVPWAGGKVPFSPTGASKKQQGASRRRRASARTSSQKKAR
jgi:hypothetical protein